MTWALVSLTNSSEGKSNISEYRMCVLTSARYSLPSETECIIKRNKK